MPTPLEIFKARAKARALLWQAGEPDARADDLKPWGELLGIEPDLAQWIIDEAYDAVRAMPAANPEPAMPVECLKFTPRKSNTLHGFCDVLLTTVKLEIRDVTLHQKGDRRWVGLPAKAQLDKDGKAVREDSGKIKYIAVLQFADRAVGDQFSDAVIAAVLKRYPSAFDPEGAA